MLAPIMNNVSQGISKNPVTASTSTNRESREQHQEVDQTSDDTTRPKHQQPEKSSLLLTLETCDANVEALNHDNRDHAGNTENDRSFRLSVTKNGRRRQRHHRTCGADDYALLSSMKTTKQKQKCWYYYWKDQLITCIRRLLLELNPFTEDWFSFVDHHPQKRILDIPSSFVPSSTSALTTYFKQLEHEEQQRRPLADQILSRRQRRRIRKAHKQNYTGLQIDDLDEELEQQNSDTWYDQNNEDDTSTASSTNGSESSDDYDTNNINDGSCMLFPSDSFEQSNNSINLDTSTDDEEMAAGDASSPWHASSDCKAVRTEPLQLQHQDLDEQHVKKYWPKLLRRRFLILFWKVLLFCITINTIVLGVINVARPGFYLAYLTHWSMTFCGFYVTANLFNCFYFNTIQQPSTTDPDNTKVPFLIKVTWFLFELASHTAAGAAFVFWPIRHLMDMPLTYNLVMNHGGIVILVLIDGMLVNRIPYRIVHWYTMIIPIQMLYVVWSLIHDFLTDIGNPDRYHPDDPSINDDALYPGVLEWSDKWPIAMATSCSILFMLGPGIVLGFWYLSIYPLPLSENFGNVSYTRLRYYDYSATTCSSREEKDRIPPKDVTTSIIVQQHVDYCSDFCIDDDDDVEAAE
jgi:hypothetical protein